MELVRLEGYVGLRLELRTAAASDVVLPAAWTVREVTGDDVPAGCRCFAVFDGAFVVHRSFVQLRPGRPILVGVETIPEARGRGAFRATVAFAARALAATGEPALFSSTLRSNRESMRAHRAAGFVVASEALDLVVLGVSLRAQARRLFRR